MRSVLARKTVRLRGRDPSFIRIDRLGQPVGDCVCVFDFLGMVALWRRLVWQTSRQGDPKFNIRRELLCR